MGDLIDLDERRRSRADHAAAAADHSSAQEFGALDAPPVTFWLDLGDPATYLAAERVERALPHATWRPASLPTRPPLDVSTLASRAQALGLPLVWPDEPAGIAQRAMRVAQHAASQGRSRAFVLAASRLAYCGGFDLEDLEVLVDAAAAAALPLDETLAAAGDVSLDLALLDAGRSLLARGATQTPCFEVGPLLVCGEARLGEAAALARTSATASG